MDLKDELLEIEERLWTGDGAAYRASLDATCLVAFPGMAGEMSRDEVAATVEDGPRWRDLDLRVEGLVRPSDDVAILTYEAGAVRGEGEDLERYRALVSSGYVRRADGWKLMFHQQAPMDGA